MGFNSIKRQLYETDDIYYELADQKRTDGLIEWANGKGNYLEDIVRVGFRTFCQSGFPYILSKWVSVNITSLKFCYVYNLP